LANYGPVVGPGSDPALTLESSGGQALQATADWDWPWPLLGRLERRSGAWRLCLPDGRLWSEELRFTDWTPKAGTGLALLGPGRRLAYARGPEGPADQPSAQRELAADEFLRLDAGPPEFWRRLQVWLEERRLTLLSNLDRCRADAGSGLADALLIGDRSRVPAEVNDLFRRTGGAHLLALSGMHVALLFALLLWPATGLLARAAGRIWPRRADLLAAWLPPFLSLGGLFFFAWLAGAASPVLRASMCCALALRGRGPLRAQNQPRAPADGATLFAFALLVELSLDPRAPFDLAAVLTYASTAGLIWLFGPCRRALRSLLPAAGTRLPPSGSLGAYAQALRTCLSRWLWAGAASTLAAQVCTAPWQWLVFGEWSWINGATTLLGLLLMTPWLAALWIAALFPGEWIGGVCRAFESACLLGLEALDRLPATPWVLPHKPAWLVLAAALLALLQLLRPQPLLARALALCGAALLWPTGPAPARAQLIALDVGHGSALALRLPGVPALIFDAGSADRVGLNRRALAPLLARWDPGRLVLVSSHLDQDHSASLEWLAARWPVKLFAGAPAWAADPPRQDLSAGRLPLQGLRSPWPISLLRAGSGDQNEGSRSLLVERPGGALLLSGDATAEGLAGLLRSGDWPLDARLVLAPHHGSDGTALLSWLERPAPAEVWISGPAGAPLEAELRRRGWFWRSTGREGWLALDLAGAHPGIPGDSPGGEPAGGDAMPPGGLNEQQGKTGHGARAGPRRPP
jgi:competence protein ComEC